MRRYDQYGNEIIGEHTELVVSATEPGLTSTAVWELQRISDRDYDRREFAREFVLVRYNAGKNQSFSSGSFNRETARALRDLLDKALSDK